MDPVAPTALVARPDAPAGGADPTRRWALAFSDGRERFPGIARTEADLLLAAPPAPAGEWDGLLVRVALPVVLSDGAGPHLLDAGGRLVLALGAHPRLPGASLAMGEARPDHRVGLVAPVGDGGLWRWLADDVVASAGRVAALDALDALGPGDDLRGWRAGRR